jgi:hypothetical protein
MAKKQTPEVKMGETTFDLLVGLTEGEVVHKEVTMREMTGNDEEAVAKPEIRGNYGKVITTLLANCITRIGGLQKTQMHISKWENCIKSLYLGDRDYCLLKLRELTYGNEMKIATKCPSCRMSLNLEFFLEELEIRQFNGEDPARIPFELPKGYNLNGTIYTKGFFKLPTGADQEYLDTMARKNPGLANTTLISKCFYELEDLKLGLNTFRDLSQRDRDYMLETLYENNFGPKFLMTVNCDGCGEEFETGVNPVNFI